MPKQKRWAIKKQLDQSTVCLDKAETYLAGVGQEYEGIHDEYTHACVLLIKALESIRETIVSIRDGI